MKFKQPKKSTSQRVGETLGAVIGVAAAKPKKKTSAKKKVLMGAVATTAVAVVAGAFTKPKNQ